MSDAFYSPSTIVRDKKAWISAALSLLVCAGLVGSVAFWRASTSLVVRPIASVSVSAFGNENNVKPTLSVEDIKKIFENTTKLSPGDRFVVYTAPLSEVCKNKETLGGSKIVIAQTKTSDILGSIKESEKNCDVAMQSQRAADLLVTSPNPFPGGIASDRKLISVAQ